MKISFDRPPVWDECVKVFDFNQSNTVFSYGGILFNPARVDIPDHLMVHEEVHAKQQQYDMHVASIWWKRYIGDPAFRLEQELEAYQAQYQFICSKIKDKNTRFRMLHAIASDLSSTMYGKVISYTEAVRRIRG